jgi:hypothetical protein
MSPFDDPASRGYARIAGILYLVIALSGGFAILYVPGVIAVPGNPVATLENLRLHRGLFLMGVLGDVVMMLAEVMLSVMLYFMFRTVNPTLSLAASYARLMMVAVMAAMLFFHAGALALAEGRVALDGFDAAQRAGIAGLLRHMHDAGVWIWQLFFCLHLLLLGALILRSGFYPRLLGLGLMLGGAGYAVDSLQVAVFPEAGWLAGIKVGLLLVVTVAELGFALWLLLRGPRVA